MDKYIGFYIDRPIGNNIFSYEDRENKKIYVPKLIEGTLDDGLTKFKDNFNPTINEFIGEFDIPVYPFMYRLTQKAYKILKSKHMW